MATKKAAAETAQETTTEKNKGGRPRRQLSRVQFESLLKINPTVDEVCAVLNTSKSMLNRWCQREYGESFGSLLKKGGQEYKTSLRRNLLMMSKKNGAVAIFLAKNELGMSDNPVPIPSGTEQQTFQRALSKAASLWDGDAQPVMANNPDEATDDAGAGQ